MKKTLRWTTVLMLIVVLNNCSETPQNPTTRQLTVEQKQELDRLTAQLLTSMHQTDFFKPTHQELVNPLRHSTVSTFISQLSEDGNAPVVQKILDHPVFAALNDQAFPMARSKDGGIELSQAAQDVLTNLSNQINGYVDDFFTTADTINFNGTALSDALIALVDDAEAQAIAQSGMSEEEIISLLSSFEIQRSLIPSIVENANSIFEATPSGGRSKGFFKKLGRYIGSVVVSMAAGAVIGGVIGAIICTLDSDDHTGASACSGIGAAIGAGVGGLVAIYQATKDRCATSWDFKKTFPLIDYVPC